MIKISTRPAYHGEWLKQEIYFTGFIISPRLGCKSTHLRAIELVEFSLTASISILMSRSNLICFIKD